jgi:hypothetical protein
MRKGVVGLGCGLGLPHVSLVKKRDRLITSGKGGTDECKRTADEASKRLDDTKTGASSVSSEKHGRSLLAIHAVCGVQAAGLSFGLRTDRKNLGGDAKGLCQEGEQWSCCTGDGGGASGAVLQERLQTAVNCFSQKLRW